MNASSSHSQVWDRDDPSCLICHPFVVLAAVDAIVDLQRLDTKAWVKRGDVAHLRRLFSSREPAVRLLWRSLSADQRAEVEACEQVQTPVLVSDLAPFVGF